MRRRQLLSLIALSTGLWLTPDLVEAKKLSIAQHEKLDAKRRAFVKSARKKAAAARSKLKYPSAQRKAASELVKRLNGKQRASLRKLSGMVFGDVRKAAQQGKKSFKLNAKRLRPHVVEVGTKDGKALAAAILLGAADQTKKPVFAAASSLQKNLNARKRLREQIAMLKSIIGDNQYPAKFSWHDAKGRKVTQTLTSKADAQNLLHDLESQLETMADMSQQLQLQLQNAMNRQAKVMQTMSNIMKQVHDTAMAIIQNMK